MNQQTVIVYNERNQPVELHLGSHVILIPPRGQDELARELIQLPQVQTLIQRKHLQILAVETRSEDQLPEEEPKGSDSASQTRIRSRKGK